MTYRYVPTARLARSALLAALCACERGAPRSAVRGSTTTAAATAGDTVVRRVVRRTRSPSAIQRVTPAIRDARALAPLDSLLVVRIYDQRGAELRDVPVDWTMHVGGAELRVIDRRTDSLGLSRARFTPSSLADTQHVVASVQGVGEIDFGIVVPATAVRVVLAEREMWADEQIAASAELHDRAGHVLVGGAVSWASTDSSVARVRSAGGARASVIGAAAGETRIVAWVNAGTVQDSVRLTVRPVVRGRFLTLDGNAPPPLRLELQSEGVRQTLSVSDGAFGARIPFAPGASVEFVASPMDPLAPFHAIDMRVHAQRDLGNVGIVLVPKTWRIDAGSYQGRDVPIDAARAMQRAGRGPGFWRLVPLSGTAPRRLLGWADSDLPLHVAFDRKRSADPVTAADSIAFWTAARQMEADLGMRLFVPADIDDSARVAVVPVEVGDQGAEGHTFLASAAEGNATDGVLLFRRSATLRDPHVVTHELLHLLGFGHTDAWPSVSVPAGGSEARLTMYDVAYAQLAVRLRRVQRETGARPGLPVAAP